MSLATRISVRAASISRRTLWRQLASQKRCMSIGAEKSVSQMTRTNVSRHPRFPSEPHEPTLPEIGQPIFETHPHLIGRGEVTPGISALEYAMRRAKLAAELPEGSIAIIPAASIKYRSGPVFYEFHQDPDFYYLTGFLEPEAVCVIEKTGKDGQHDFHMFVRPKNEQEELWDGPRAGIENAMDIFNADESGDINNIQSLLSPIIQRSKHIFADVKSKSNPRTAFERLFWGHPDFSSLAEDRKVSSLRSTMDKLRAIKSPAEVKTMRMAGKMSGLAHNALIREVTWDSEARVSAYFESCVRLGGHLGRGPVGCEKLAYVPVVAAGKKALTLHYTKNNDIIAEGDLVLIDGGGQYGGYVSDITRTWPNASKFSDAQKDLYQVVLQAQRNCISNCAENKKKSLDEIHDIAHNEMLDGLRQLGFDISSSELRDRLFPHHVGHYIGLDLHDTKTYGRVTPLRTGHCVTIEPGLYIPDDERYPKHFRNMGIRIEDSICVGEEGPINLTTEAVKEVEDIEALINS